MLNGSVKKKNRHIVQNIMFSVSLNKETNTSLVSKLI